MAAAKDLYHTRPMAMVKLRSAASHDEARLVQGLLQAHGVPCVIHGESQHTGMGTEAGFAEILLLVPEEALADAREVLAAQPDPDAAPGAETPAGGALCPVHEQEATGTCARCGSYVCAGCGPLGVPPICEACADHLAAQPRRRAGRRLVALLLLAILLGVPALLAALLAL